MDLPTTIALATGGYLVLRVVFTAEQVDAIVRQLDDAFARDATGSTLRTEDGSVYGARNLLQLWPNVAMAWRAPSLV